MHEIFFIYNGNKIAIIYFWGNEWKTCKHNTEAFDLKIKPIVVIIRHGHFMNIQIPLHGMWYPGALAEGFFVSLNLNPEKN